jgi:hypothetical protein
MDYIVIPRPKCVWGGRSLGSVENQFVSIRKYRMDTRAVSRSEMRDFVQGQENQRLVRRRTGVRRTNKAAD